MNQPNNVLVLSLNICSQSMNLEEYGKLLGRTMKQDTRNNLLWTMFLFIYIYLFIF